MLDLRFQRHPLKPAWVRRYLRHLAHCASIVMTGAAAADAQICSPSTGTVRYVLSSATGANNGTSWTNAYTSVATAESNATRGDTICVGDGNYGSVAFNTPASGTTLITIAKATIPDHGTDSGWNNSYGDGQAIFSGWTVTSSYWRFTGVTGGGPGTGVSQWPGSWENNLGFVINGNIGGTSGGGTKRGLTFEHIELNGGMNAAGGPRAVDLWDLDGVTFRYMYIHNWGEDTFRFAIGTRNFLVEYSKIARMWQDGSAHADVVESQGDGGPYILRWSIFEDVVGSYWFGSHSGTISGYQVYGNIFDGRTKQLEATNGVMANLSGGGSLADVAFCSNTMTGAWGIYQMGIANMGGGSIAGVARSNIWNRRSGSSNLSIAVTQSANTTYGQSLSGAENLSGDPFVNYAAYDYRLASESTAGVLSGCPAANNVDMFGVTRGVNGVVTRGALELGSSSTSVPPAAPTNVRIITP
jgi:hypothetical protein